MNEIVSKVKNVKCFYKLFFRSLNNDVFSSFEWFTGGGVLDYEKITSGILN